MKEAGIQSSLREHLLSKDNTFFKSRPFLIELKLCNLTKKKRFPFSEVKQHQIDNLLEAQINGFYHKIKDDPFGQGGHRFHTKKPFDCIYIPLTALPQCYVGICFYQPYKLKRLFLFTINEFIAFRSSHPKKSFTYEECLTKDIMHINL